MALKQVFVRNPREHTACGQASGLLTPSTLLDSLIIAHNSLLYFNIKIVIIFPEFLIENNYAYVYLCSNQNFNFNDSEGIKYL